MASAYTRIAKSRMVSRSRPGGNGNGQRDGAADDLDGMDIGWLKPFATPRTGTLQKATDAAEAPTGRRHALVQKTWMPWRRPGCRGEAAAGDGLRGWGGARSDVAKKLRIARAEKGAAVGLDAKK